MNAPSITAGDTAVLAEVREALARPFADAIACRLNWLSQVQGTCVFKDLEKNRSFAISLEELREKRRAGLAVIVDGAGVAQSSIDGAIADVARGMGAA